MGLTIVLNSNLIKPWIPRIITLLSSFQYILSLLYFYHVWLWLVYTSDWIIILLTGWSPHYIDLVCFKNLNRFWKILLSPRMIKGQSNDRFFFLDEYCIIRNKIAFLSTMPPSNRFRDVSSAKTLVFFLFLAFYLVNFRNLKDLFVYLGVFLSYWIQFESIVFIVWKKDFLMYILSMQIKRVGPNKRVGWIFYVNFIKNRAK